MIGKTFRFVVVMVLLAVLLTACGPAGAPPANVVQSAPRAAVYALQPGTTARIIVDGLNGVAQTRLFMNGDLVMIAKPLPEIKSWGFVCLQCKGSIDPVLNFVRVAGGKGNLVDPATFSWLAKSMTEGGWEEVRDPKLLPPSLLAWKTAGQWAGEQVVDTAAIIAKTASTALVSWLVVPAGMLIPPDYIQGDAISY